MRTWKDYSTPIENKESYRWLENYKYANEIATAFPETMIVTMADRESDITAERIKSTLKSEMPLGEITLEISETKKRKARTSKLTIYSKRIYIALPDKFKKDKDYKPIEITAILCIGLNPPAESKVIEWLLLLFTIEIFNCVLLTKSLPQQCLI